MKTMKMNGKLTAILVVGLCATAFGSVPWSNPSGTAASFSWENGQNQTGNFGSPENAGDWLLFLGSNFDAAADTNMPSDTKTDQLDVDILALPGLSLTRIELYAFGDYSISDPMSTGGNSVTADFDMTADAYADDLYFTENTPGGGNWYEIAAIDLPDVSNVHLSVAGNVIAIADGQGGASSITANTNIKIKIVPEPATLALLSVAGLALIRRR